MKQLEELPREFKAQGDFDHPDGVYHIPHPWVKGYYFWLVFSTGLGWEHLSISIKRLISKRKRQVGEAKRCPTWEEMCMAKDLFWTPEECVVQYHPPMMHYVNMHKWCLHLWRPITMTLPVPDPIMVGLKDKLKDDAEVMLKLIHLGKQKKNSNH